jgi:hypothetical protein
MFNSFVSIWIFIFIFIFNKIAYHTSNLICLKNPSESSFWKHLFMTGGNSSRFLPVFYMEETFSPVEDLEKKKIKHAVIAFYLWLFVLALYIFYCYQIK